MLTVNYSYISWLFAYLCLFCCNEYGSEGKESICNSGDTGDAGLISG